SLATLLLLPLFTHRTLLSFPTRRSSDLECPFFSGRKIDNVKVGPSPQWLRAKIESVGIRSINNIVDISNFVMLELGQPTHAFDRSEEHTSELQSRFDLVCRLLLEKKKHS